MSAIPNIEDALNRSAAYVQAIWQQVVMGTQQVPGAVNPQVNIGLRQIYANSITLGNMITGQGSVSRNVVALKKIAEELEKGKGKWDMKPMLLGGPKARIGKNGNRYNIIPFRHGTSSKSAPNNYFPTMSKDIYKKARALKATKAELIDVGRQYGVYTGRTSWGSRLTGTETAHPPGQNPTSGYRHKAGKYEGMVRIEKSYAAATQNKYMTFRVVSSNSDPASWWHPGYKAHNISAGVADFCRPAVEKMIGEAARADLVNAVVTVGGR